MLNEVSYLTYYQILTFFSLGLGIYLSILVYSANPKAPANRIFILFTFLALIWSTGPYVGNLIGVSQWSIIYLKFCYALAALNGYIGYLLITRLFPKIPKYRSLDITALIFGLLDFLFAFLPFFIKNIELTSWGINPIFGTGRFLYFPTIVFFVVIVPYLIIKTYRRAPPMERSQYSYFLSGFFLFVITAGVGNVLAPLLGYSASKYWLIGCFGPVFLISFAAMAVFRGQAFEVKSILTDLLVGIFGITLLILPLFLTGPMRILGLLLFSFFIIIGYSLIQYTHREVRQKEILEERVKERTKELETAKDIAEGRAKEIEKRKEDLEKFYKLTVGRELRMIELKKQIKELEEKMKEKEN